MTDAADSRQGVEMKPFKAMALAFGAGIAAGIGLMGIGVALGLWLFHG